MLDIPTQELLLLHDSSLLEPHTGSKEPIQNAEVDP
jgi:hypothetical protein